MNILHDAQQHDVNTTVLGRMVSLVTSTNRRYEGTIVACALAQRTITLDNVRDLSTETGGRGGKKGSAVGTVVFDLNGVTHMQYIREDVPSQLRADPAVLSVCPATRPKESRSRNGQGKSQGVHLNDLVAGRGKRHHEVSSQTAERGRRVSFRELVEGSKGKNHGRNKNRKEPNGRVPQIPANVPHRFASDRRDPLLQTTRSKKTLITGTNKTDEVKFGAKLKHPGRFEQGKLKVKFDDEFDFDKGFEEFKELNIAENKAQAEKDVGENVLPRKVEKEPGDFYNKEKSFFDNISSEENREPVLEQNKRKDNRKKEIETNKQTFGTTFVPGRRKFTRGPPRPRRYPAHSKRPQTQTSQ
jgi:hypothetical protein